jgi:hypothetical protein
VESSAHPYARTSSVSGRNDDMVQTERVVSVPLAGERTLQPCEGYTADTAARAASNRKIARSRGVVTVRPVSPPPTRRSSAASSGSSRLSWKVHSYRTRAPGGVTRGAYEVCRTAVLERDLNPHASDLGKQRKESEHPR